MKRVLYLRQIHEKGYEWVNATGRIRTGPIGAWWILSDNKTEYVQEVGPAEMDPEP